MSSFGNGPDRPPKAAADRPDPRPDPEAPWPDFTAPRTKSTVEFSAEEFRHYAAARVMEQLDVSSGLIQQCEHLAALPETDRLATINASARLMNANAHLARALSRLVQGETRHRQIVERVQPPRTLSPDSFSQSDAGPPTAPTAATNAEAAAMMDLLQHKMLRYMAMVACEKLDPELREAFPDDYAPPEGQVAPRPGEDTPAKV